MSKLWFMGWWHENEKADSDKPWEEFEVVLMGMEAGDAAENIGEVLEASGYELILRKKDGSEEYKLPGDGRPVE